MPISLGSATTLFVLAALSAATCQNALRSRFENLWSSEHASVVRLVEDDDIIEKMIYAPCLGYFLAAIRRSNSCLMITSANSGTTSHTTCSMISRESLAIASYSRPRAAMAATF